MPIIARRNYVTNPGFEYDLSGWTVVGSATHARAAGVYTTYQNRITWPTAALGVPSDTTVLTGLVIGRSYTMWALVAASTKAVRLFVSGGSAGPSFTVSDGSTKQSKLTFTATATTHTIGIRTAAATVAGDTTGIDAIIVEDGTVAYSYFDGDTPGALWATSPGHSQSTLARYDTTPTAMPGIVVEIDAAPIHAGDFMLDSSALDGPDFLVGSPRWWAIDNVLEVATRRGRQRDDSAMQPGELTVTIDDYAGTYDPDNPSTPLVTNGQPVLRTKMRMRAGVTIDYLGWLYYYPLFTGNFEDVEIDRGFTPRAVLTASDDVAVLNNADVPPAVTPFGEGATSLEHLTWLAGYSSLSPDDMRISTNVDRLLRANAGSGNAGSGFTNVANANGGLVYAAADGAIVVTAHADDFISAVGVSFTDHPTVPSDVTPDEVKTSTSVRQIINRTRVDRGEGVDNVTAQDDDSVALNGVRSETVTAPLFNLEDAQDLAQWRASRRAKGGTRVNSVSATATGQTAWWIPLAQLDIATLIEVERYSAGRGIDLIGQVQGVDHTLTATSWMVTAYTSPTDSTGLFPGEPHAFFLDSSSLDGPDFLTAY